MEEAAKLSDNLPLYFTSPSEQDYVTFLWDAFETNLHPRQVPVRLSRLPHAYHELRVL